jgi:hypothetical protein
LPEGMEVLLAVAKAVILHHADGLSKGALAHLTQKAHSQRHDAVCGNVAVVKEADPKTCNAQAD